ncbi:hypothetical protein [Microbulbifer sp. S227A]|uniref:hypothetical protein n=1 Tax=Microbulbifer sp. S227A TaxID=3415131 RepID=UPI003C7AE92D
MQARDIAAVPDTKPHHRAIANAGRFFIKGDRRGKGKIRTQPIGHPVGHRHPLYPRRCEQLVVKPARRCHVIGADNKIVHFHLPSSVWFAALLLANMSLYVTFDA